jgi:hypothetical protein
MLAYWALASVARRGSPIFGNHCESALEALDFHAELLGAAPNGVQVGEVSMASSALRPHKPRQQ